MIQKKDQQKVVTRFAPSPTGYFHAGSYRTALFSWIYARQNNGRFILRIEDTDKERSKKEYEDNIIDSLKWLGLNYDGFFRQSERTDIYQKYIKRLIESGHAYISDESQKRESLKIQNNDLGNTGEKSVSDNNQRSSVIRFKNPNKKVIFNDLIRGQIEFDTTELGDFVIAKSETEPVFHLVVVVDDMDMGITHIIRGEDHISNTPRQILIFEALGVTPPIYAHIPLLLATDRSKLSKRKGALPMTEYKNRGYLPESLINYMALLGWHPKDDREVIDMVEILDEFSLDRVQKGGAIFDEEKLRWFNRQYILKLSPEQFEKEIIYWLPKNIKIEDTLLHKLIPIIKDKISSFDEVSDLFDVGGELNFIAKDEQKYPVEMLHCKKETDLSMTTINLRESLEIIQAIDDDRFNPENIKASLWPLAESKGKGNILWPVRVALTGQEKSPDPFICAHLLGKDESLKRIQYAIEILN